MNPKRFLKSLRWWVVLPLPIFVIFANSFGPDGWREPLERVLWLSWASLAVAATHLARKALHDYADAEEAYKKAITGSTGAGLVFAGLCIIGAALFFGFISMAKAQDVKTYIPKPAVPLLPVLSDVQKSSWPEMPFPSYFGALIEHESCIYLTHSSCWNPRARLKTAREEGGSLGQFTRAWNADGSLRFDAVEEVRRLDPQGLRDFNWSTIYTRPELSMRAVVVKTKDCHNRFFRLSPAALPYNVLAFCDSAYNGGFGGLLTDRRLCAASKGCDPNQWFGHVERFSLKSRTKWQGYGKSAFDINRHHVIDVLLTRRPKYVKYLGADTK